MRKPITICALFLVAACSDEPTPAADPVTPQIQASSGTMVQPEASSEANNSGFGEMAAIPAGGAIGCSPDEEPVFACNLDNGKRLAVCATGSETVEYRYGGAKSELVLSGGAWANAAYSGGGEAQIAFENGDTRYIVFSRMIRTNFEAGEPNDPAMSDGVIAERAGKVLAVRTCDDPNVVAIQYSAAEKVLPQADDLFTNETERADPEWTN